MEVLGDGVFRQGLGLGVARVRTVDAGIHHVEVAADTHALAAATRHGIERHALVGEGEVGGGAGGENRQDGRASGRLGLQDVEAGVCIRGERGAVLASEGKVRGAGKLHVRAGATAVKLGTVDHVAVLGFENLGDVSG